MKKINKVVIPVAGLGTRMLPATKAIPKEMLPIVNKPIIQYIFKKWNLLSSMKHLTQNKRMRRLARS